MSINTDSSLNIKNSQMNFLQHSQVSLGPFLTHRQGVQAWRGGRSRLERRPPRRPGPAVGVLGAPGRVWAVGGGGAAVKQQSARREEGEGEGRGGEGKAPAAGSDVPRSPCRAAPTINSLSKHQTTARASESDK